jgi:hypothetical protein
MSRPPVPDFRDQWLAQKPAAEILKISEPALEADRWTPTLGIPYYKFGTRVRYRLSELIAWAEAHRVVPVVRTGEPDAPADEGSRHGRRSAAVA